MKVAGSLLAVNRDFSPTHATARASSGNDIPARNVGVAIGARTDVAVEAGGIVLIRSDPRHVPRIITLSRDDDVPRATRLSTHQFAWRG